MDYRLKAISLSRLEIEVMRRLSGGDIESAVSFASSAGWLEKTDAGLIVNREREECETKLEQLGLLVPWK